MTEKELKVIIKAKLGRPSKIVNKNMRLYNIWKSIKQRCYNSKNKDFKNYGGRGITVCDEWKNDFNAFYDWAMANDYKDDLTIDRVNTNADYSPNNCRWVNRIIQNNNTRRNLYITYNGETHTVAEWENILNISRNVLRLRLFRNNWSVEKAFETPTRQWCKR